MSILYHIFASAALLFMILFFPSAVSSALPSTTPTLNIPDYNQSPIANAGADQTTNAGTIVTLDGSHSYDPNIGGAITSYLWRQISGIPVILSGSNTPNPTFTAPIGSAGDTILTFSLTVTDNSGAINTTPSIVHVFVRHDTNQSPLSSALIPHYQYPYQYPYPSQNQNQQQEHQQPPPSAAAPLPLQGQQQFQKPSFSTTLPNPNTAAATQSTNNSAAAPLSLQGQSPPPPPSSSSPPIANAGPDQQANENTSTIAPLPNSSATTISTKDNSNNNTTAGLPQSSAGATPKPSSAATITPDAAATAPGTISGVVYYDTNGNLKQDAGDTLVPNWNVKLFQNGQVVSTVSTGPNGSGYSFTSVSPGTYTISAGMVNPYVPTQPLNNTYSVTVASTDSKLTRNFGIFKNPSPLIGGANLNSDLDGFTVEGMVFDAKGYLYDVDKKDNLIKKFDKQGNLVASFGNNTLSGPGGIAIDSQGNIIVSEFFHKLLKLDPNGNLLTSFGILGNGTGQLNRPRGLAIDPADNLYVANGDNNVVQKYDKNGNYLRKIGSRAGGLPWSYLVMLFDVKLDSHGNIFVADTSNNRVQKFDPNGNFLLNIGKSGAAPALGGAGNGQFNKPRAIAIGPNDVLYVADTYNNRIQVLDNNGNFIRTFGQMGSDPGQFLNPSGIVVDSSTGNIYVADTGNARIQIFNSNGQFLSQFKTGIIPMEPYFSYIDKSGHLLVSDGANHVINRFDTSTGSFLSQFGALGTAPGTFHGPRGIAQDNAGNIWIADNYNNRVQKFDPNGKFLLTFGTRGTGPGQFNQPRGLVIDSSGNVLVSDTQNNRIQKFDPNGKFLTSFTTPNMVQPYQIALDKNGNIYAAEQGTSHIEKLDSTGKSLMIIGSSGTGPGQFTLVKGVYVDSSGNIYTTDAKRSNIIQKFDAKGNFLMGFGSPCTSGVNCPHGQFFDPRGIMVDLSGNIWVDDTQNDRVQEFNSSGNFIKQITHSQ